MAENLTHITDKAHGPVTRYNLTPESTAEEFSTSKAYAVGDYCFYSGDFYKCKIAKVAGAWSADNFEKVTISEELKGIVNGYHPDMTAGDAEQLVSTQYVTDKTPYLYRTTGGSSDVGNREYVRGITGGTVAWNQLVKSTDYATITSNGVTYTNNGDGSISVSGTATSMALISKSYALIQNHVYLFRMCPTGGSRQTYFGDTGAGIGNDFGNGGLGRLTGANGAYYFRLYVAGGVTVTNIKFYPQIFDITAMFGSTIADYIYSLEQANAGAGVTWFRKLFPNDYYPYNAGELKSVEGVSSHEMVRFNQWDEEWEVGGIGTDGSPSTASDRIRSKNYVPILGNTGYYFTVPSVTWRMFFYDSDKNFISYVGTYTGSRLITTPSNARYAKFYAVQTLYQDNICINLSWSGTHNGEYKPYEKHTYALDSSLTLRGIPKLDASNNLFYDGDVYAPDGTVTRKYGIVDLGTLSWAWNSTYSTWNVSDGAVPIKNDGYSQIVFPPMMCEKYVPLPMNTLLAQDVYNVISYNPNNGGNIFVKMADDSVRPSGYLVFELATPTTETADPYTEIQICDDWGTEEYVSTSIVPVGHTTDYPANLRDKLQHLPDLASADGNYIVSQSGTQMTLAPLPIVIPAPPTTDGTYTFRATVSNGVPTLSWVAE